MRGGHVVIVAVLALLAGLVGPGDAYACSCAPTPPREALARADAAIVGRLLKVEPRGAARAAYRYRVRRVYRGGDEIEPRSTVTVLSGRDSTACALPTRIGRRYGLLLLGQRGRWASGLCGVLSPRRLWEAARGASASDGAGSASNRCAS